MVWDFQSRIVLLNTFQSEWWSDASRRQTDGRRNVEVDEEADTEEAEEAEKEEIVDHPET